jgi:hypothetical protein
MSPLEECWRRIDRAHTHCTAFVTGWNLLLEDDSYTFGAEMKDERTGVVHASLITPIRHELSLELGEFFYQIRAALDGAVYRAVMLKRGSEQITGINRLDFPVCMDISKFDTAALHKNPFPDKLREWIEHVQPYYAGKTPEEAEISAFLHILHDCARKDRHRQLHLVAAVPQDLGGIINVPAPARITHVKGIGGNLLEKKCELFEFGIQDTFPGMNINLNGKFTIQVSIDEIPGAVGEQVVKTLLRIEAVAKLAVKRFEEEFEVGANQLAPPSLSV